MSFSKILLKSYKLILLSIISIVVICFGIWGIVYLSKNSNQSGSTSTSNPRQSRKQQFIINNGTNQTSPLNGQVIINNGTNQAEDLNEQSLITKNCFNYTFYLFKIF